MAGHPTGDTVRAAHADSSASAGTDVPWHRESREEAEDAQLAPGATRASGGGNRPRAEQPDDERTCFCLLYTSPSPRD